MNSYDLSCRYDSRQSFYGKARVEITTSPDLYVEKLYSYGTLVAIFRQQGLTEKEIKELFKNGELTIEYSVDIPF